MSQTPPPAGPPGGQPPYPGSQQPGPPQYGQQPQYGGQPSYGGQPPYGGPPQQPGQYGMPPMAPIQGIPQQQYQGPPQGTNGLAIASLILGIIGVILFSVITGVIALRQVKERNQNGRGLAIAGLVISGCWVLLFGVGLIVALATDDEPSRDASGQVTETTNVRPDKLKVGDCVESIDAEGEIRNMKLVPCSGPNGGEVYANFELPAGKWPGLSAVQADAEAGCTDRADALKGQAAKESDIYYLHPVEESWSLGDRGVTCLVVPK
ncbi:DUF4190 domain-containing protein [Kribbella sp. NPDC058245]|uniref:DUF4190 domain-containing protein n=1 Tax=Kribbella sp. NPDC058245 TaxID=3346399 RepID=UPI0036EEC210